MSTQSRAPSSASEYRGLWRNNPATRKGKFLVLRRDGTVPDWPNFVLGARDPAAPAALRAYADAAQQLGMHSDYVHDVRELANEFEEWLADYGAGDPDAPKHRKDDPFVLAKMHGTEEP